MAGRPIAVTVQYPGHEHEQRIHELGAGTGFEFVPLLSKPAPVRTDSVSYARELVAALPEDAPPVGAVIAWCTSSAIGLEVARLLEERSGVAPVFVALDGVRCTAVHIAEAYQEAVRRYAPGRTGELTFDADEVRTRPDAVLDAVRAELTRYATEVLLGGIGQADWAAPIVDEVVAVSMDWLTLLVAAHNSAHDPWDGEVVVVTSAETQFPGSWPGIPRLSTVELKCSAAELIGAEEIAPLVAGYLAGSATDRA